MSGLCLGFNVGFSLYGVQVRWNGYGETFVQVSISNSSSPILSFLRSSSTQPAGQKAEIIPDNNPFTLNSQLHSNFDIGKPSLNQPELIQQDVLRHRLEIMKGKHNTLHNNNIMNPLCRLLPRCLRYMNHHISNSIDNLQQLANHRRPMHTNSVLRDLRQKLPQLTGQSQRHLQL